MKLIYTVLDNIKQLHSKRLDGIERRVWIIEVWNCEDGCNMKKVQTSRSVIGLSDTAQNAPVEPAD